MNTDHAEKSDDAEKSHARAFNGPGAALLYSARARIPIDAQRLGLTTFALAFSGGTTLLFTLVLVRVLPPASYGNVARTFSLGMAVAQLAMAGIAPAIAREVAHGRDEPHRLARARGGALALAYCCGAVSLLFFPLVFAGLGPTNRLSLLLGWSLAFIYATYFGLKLILFALNLSARYAGLELICDAVFFATLIVLALLAPTAGVLTFSLAYALFIVLATRLIYRRGSTTERLPIDRRILTYTGWASVATYTSVARFPIAVALTGALTGSMTAGRLAAVLSISAPLYLVPAAAAMLTFADVARAAGSAGDPGRPVRLMCRVSALVSALIIPTCCLFAPEIVPLLLGAGYRSAVSSFLVVILCVTPQLAVLTVGQALAAQGAVRLNAACGIGAFVVLILGTVLLVSSHGLVGGAIAVGISEVVAGLIILFLGHVRYSIGPRELAGSAVALGVGLVAVICNGAPLAARIGVELIVLSAVAYISWRTKWHPFATQGDAQTTVAPL
jgi:O-antigen/teichoic acid export membrane protein